MSELHRQGILTGFAVVRRIDGENVFLPSGQLCRVVHPGAVDFHGMDAAQGTDQPFLVELTVIHFHEVHHTLQDCGTEGIGFALPCVHNQPQSLAVDFLAHLVVQLECSAYAADAVVAQLQAVIVEVQTHPVGGCEECHGKSILAHDLGTELDARRQRCSVTVLLCEEQGFLLHRQTRIHLAENREVFATVAQDTRFNGVLTVRYIIPAIAKADLRLIRRIFIASLTDGMGTPIVALAKLLAVSNFYRDVLGYDAFGDDNKAVAIVANDHRGGKDSNNASAGYGRSKIFTRISVGATCSPTIDTLGHEVTHAVEQSISRMTYEGESGALMEAMGIKAGIPNSLFLDENENSVVSIDGQAKLYVYAWDGTLCDNYDLHIAQLDTDILPREYDENVQKIVAYDYTIREAEAFQIDLTPGIYEFRLTDPNGRNQEEVEYLRVVENNGLKGYPFYPGFENANVLEVDISQEPKQHSYGIFYDTLTWEQAKAACEAKGGHLVTITSPEEQKLIESLNTQNSKLWIGGYKNSAGQWCWVTGEPWEYQNWGDGEPNNSSNVVADESCVAVWPVKWNDLANSNTYEQSGYICEWEASDAAEETQVEGYTGHLYEFYTLPESEWESGPITWQQAEKRCEWKGGHLAVIESSTENFLLYSAMKAKGYENAYFGFSDESSEGNWKWVNGTSTSYTNWHSGEPSNQDGIEHYAMFYEKFQDGTWNDADGIIDAGCAYICEWDDPTDKISQGDSFTDQQLRIIAKDLGVPDDLNVEIRQSPKAYWEAAGLWDIYVEITHNGKLVASGSFDVETGEMGRNIYIYTPV